MATLAVPKAWTVSRHRNFKLARSGLYSVGPRIDAHNEISNAALRVFQEMLFGIALLGDDRAVSATYANGHCVHRRDAMKKLDGHILS